VRLKKNSSGALMLSYKPQTNTAV